MDRKQILKEIAKDCVAFANAQGGVIDFGIEDNAIVPDATQRIPKDLPVKLRNQIAERQLMCLPTQR